MKSVAVAALALLSSEVAADFTLIAGYEPGSNVGDHIKVDLDQAEIERQLKLGNDVNFENAKNVYINGAHSKSQSPVTLKVPLTKAYDKGIKIVGKNTAGGAVSGTMAGDKAAEISEIKIQMDPEYECYVGGRADKDFTGCFAATGTLTIADEDYEYEFDQATTTNGRNIQGFSTKAGAKMAGQVTFEKFKAYYGRADYADHWIMSAFAGTDADFTNGDANFASSNYGKDGTSQAIKKGSAYMSVWMYVIHEMEDAIGDCNDGCGSATCNDDPGVHAWDEAVAFYSGTLEGTDGSGSGVMPHALAEKRASNFKTNDAAGNPKVNVAIFEQFALGKANLQAKKCDDVKVNKDKIVNLMTIPLIQGTLRYSYKSDTTYSDISEKGQAEGATFGAAVLPLVHACDAAAATTIYNNVKVRAITSSSKFTDVKAAFESVYECLGVSCEHVGGLYDDSTSKYMVDAPPCGGTFPVNGDDAEDTTVDDADSASAHRSLALAAALMAGAFATVIGF